MLIGELRASRLERASIHFLSDHLWLDSVTIEAVSGGICVWRAIGSIFLIQAPALVRISYLYAAPASIPGMKISQTPVEPITRIA